MNRLVVFDLDHTLIKGNSSFLFGVFLYQNKQLPFLTMLRLTSYYALYKLKLLSISEMQTRCFNTFFRNHEAGQIKKLAEQFISEKGDKWIRPSVFEQLQVAQAECDYTVLLSSGPSFLVELFAKKFKVDFWDASHFAVIEGKFSHISRFMFGVDKAEAVIELSNTYAIPKDQITAYSDSIDDLLLLEAVGNPVGVDPDRRLKNICKQRGWAILS